MRAIRSTTKDGIRTRKESVKKNNSASMTELQEHQHIRKESKQ